MEQEKFDFEPYPTDRDIPDKSSVAWLKGKRIDDNLDGLWRVHNKLYDLREFIGIHPGGSEWIKDTEGTDITEAFEASHLFGIAEVVLRKYYVKDIETPRTSPFTFKEDGFYRTLKRRVAPLLKNIGTGPTRKMLLIQDSLVLGFIFFAILTVYFRSYLLAMVTGLVLGMSTSCAHNFFHQRDNWRMYIWDLSTFSSHEWRISHKLSHHLHTNTLNDVEISALEPFILFLPTSKNWIQKYASQLYIYLLFGLLGHLELIKRVLRIVKREQMLRPENLFPLIQLVVFSLAISSFKEAYKLWFIMHTMSVVWFAGTAIVASHHHPDIYHAGDEHREDRDWGLHQMDATFDVHKTSSLFLVSTTFGDHTLHHLFPTVDHSKLWNLYPLLHKTCVEFGVEHNLTTQFDMLIGMHQQLARTESRRFNPKKKNE